MCHQETAGGPIMRLFQVQARRGCARTLIEKFGTTSVDVVRNEPGNRGYFFGQGVTKDEDYVVFASLWKDLDAVKKRFGEEWHKSFLPPGYEELIEQCSVHHVDLSAGWQVRPGE